MQSDARILLELRADLLTDLRYNMLPVRKVQVLRQCLGELIGGDKRLVEVPAEDVSQLIRHCRLLWTVLGERNVCGVGVGRRIWGMGSEGGNVEINADGDKGKRQTGLSSILLISADISSLADPFAPNPLDIYRLPGLLAGPIGQVLS